jgi:hypothetical protein
VWLGGGTDLYRRLQQGQGQGQGEPMSPAKIWASHKRLTDLTLRIDKR